LAPLASAELARQYRRVLSETLVCHPWICQLTFTAEETGPMVLQFPTTLGDRLHGFSLGPTRNDVDATSGAKLRIVTFFLLLRHPAGEPRTDEQLRGEIVASLPGTDAQCQPQLRDLRDREERAEAQERERKARSYAPAAFAAEKPNAALTAETARLLGEAFGLPHQPADQVVDCRQSVCKLLIPVDGERIRKLRTGTLGPRYEWTATSGTRPDETDIFLWWNSPARANSRQLLRDAARAADASRGQCARLPPARGGLTVHLELAASEESGPPPRPTITVEGSLAGTPLGRCLAALVEAKVRASSTLGPFARSSYAYDFLFTGK
jgi:hypothetical protein